jgi:hypothetical protein
MSASRKRERQRGPSPRACQRCKEMKVKCDSLAGNVACHRCCKAGTTCLYRELTTCCNGLMSSAAALASVPAHVTANTLAAAAMPVIGDLFASTGSVPRPDHATSSSTVDPTQLSVFPPMEPGIQGDHHTDGDMSGLVDFPWLAFSALVSASRLISSMLTGI